MKLSEDLAWRGLIKDKTFEDIAWLDDPKKFYLGIDASSSGLTIGNLAVVMLARRLIETGWKAVILAGGATSLVGDPGGKEEERNLKTKEEIEANIKGVQTELERLLASDSHEMVNNLDWLGELKYLDFLRDTGKYYSMTELMQRDFVNTRMGEEGSGISYAEFSYSLLQGYDFWWLYKNKDVELQIGASDQWGNMLSGVPLVRKKEGKEVHAMSMPLVINKATGVKFGKSEAGAIWLDPAKTSPTQFYQFWINASDEDAEDYLKIYTFLDKEEINAVMDRHRKHAEERYAQIRLAHEVTQLVHGHNAMDRAENVTFILTGKINIGQAVNMGDLREEIPSVKAKVGDEIVQILVDVGLVPSKREGREIRASGGIYINGEGTTSEYLQKDHFQNGRLLLRKGKAFKDSALVELE